ncbi:hypothetical protein, partial [Roseovarius sp. D0-M9]|uniref:hypothetical protein n=1 Tax=Roseovarius sp. D0-M9 TaxID=3127117 RepID=UPI00300FD5A1
RRSAQAPARVTLRHNIWCGRELTGDPHTHTNREEALFYILQMSDYYTAEIAKSLFAVTAKGHASMQTQHSFCILICSPRYSVNL